MTQEVKFTFPYAEFVETAFEVVPQCLREVENSELLSDLMVAKTALTCFRRIAPVFDVERGTPWLAFARVVFSRDLRNAVRRGQFIADEEKALALLDSALDGEGVLR